MINILLLIIAINFLLFMFVFLRANELSSKLLVLNSLTAISATFLAIVAYFTGQDFYIDISILYALIGYIANAAFLKLRKS